MSDPESEEEDFRPTFVPKTARVTLKNEAEDRNSDKREQYNQTTRAEVLNLVRQVKEEKVKGDSSDTEIENLQKEIHGTSDEVEYHQWKVRELNRINRERQERQEFIEERNQLLARRNLSDEDIMAQSESYAQPDRGDKPKWKFLQKYYHKGVFYMDNSSIKDTTDVRTKEYSEPTLEDKVDKESLPKIMQVKNFGKKGRTKYTHLVDQDTTLKDNKRVNYRIDQKIFQSVGKKRKL